MIKRLHHILYMLKVQLTCALVYVHCCMLKQQKIRDRLMPNNTADANATKLFCRVGGVNTIRN